MKTITKYVANDGQEFNIEDECVKYETLISNVDEIMAKLPALPKDDHCEFANGRGCIMHDEIVWRQAKLSLLELIKPHIKHKWVQETINDSSVHLSYVGRLIDDHNHLNPISRALSRIMCIDSQNREWGQPYYVANPEKASSQEPIQIPAA